MHIVLPQDCNHIDVIHALHDAGAFASDASQITVTVPRNAFLHTPAIAFLCAWALDQEQQGRTVRFAGDQNVLNYLSRLNLFRHIQQPYAEQFNRHDAAGRFIPLRLIADELSVGDASNAVCDLVLRNLDNAEAFLPALEWCVYEVLDNVRLHANVQVPGVVCAQVFPQLRRLDVAICDVGQGIRRSLSESHQIDTDEQALRMALQRGVTRNPQVGQGNGLAGSLEISRLNGGDFDLWSGNALYDLATDQVHPLPTVPGTGVLFSLDIDRPIRLEQTFIGDSGWSYLDVIATEADQDGRIVVRDECLNTGTRESAAALRRKISALLPRADGSLTLDFSAVERSSSSFLDELLGRLANELGPDAFWERIKLVNMAGQIADMANVVIHQRLESSKIPMTQKSPLAPASATELREQLQEIVLADLLGPANGPEEIIDEGSVRDRYLIGRLGPQGQSVLSDEEDPLTFEDTEGELATVGGDGEDGVAETDATRRSMQPSSIGLSFVAAGSTRALRLTARWGRYIREKGEGEEYKTKLGTQRRIWRRQPVEGVSDPIPLLPGRMPAWVPNPEQPNIRVDGMIRERGNQWHITLFLVNGQQEPKLGKDAAWIFQPELIVEDSDGQAIFEWRPTRDDDAEAEVRAMSMAYRNTLEFAVGHGVSVHADVDDSDSRRAVRLSTRITPLFEIPQTRAFVPDGLVLDMRILASIPDGGFGAALRPMLTFYRAWIDELERRGQNPSADLDPYISEAADAIEICRKTAERIEAGIQMLDTNAIAAQSFRFANRAMADQRVRSLFAYAQRQGREVDLADLEADPANHSWRTFQLAFFLLNLPAITDPTHAERAELADLLWFPTGGGKTEAYLGVAAYTMAIRRLQGKLGNRSGHAGVAVLMRYTLRLLTLQQFQRATALICACEVIRREDPAKWGSEPFRIGLWVGQNSTPNWTDQADEAIKQIRNRNFYSGSTPHQLTNCPWCGSPINPGRDIEIETFQQGRGRTYVYCSDPVGRCAFSKRQAPDEGLPILTVDEEIYRRLPTLLIATVDKFARMPWEGRIGMLFGQVNGYCERHGYRSPEVEDSNSHPAKGKLPRARTIETDLLRPPDLIIQDELHLISGPLGTMVGLYETAVDRLSTWELNGHKVQPKVIASTATIRRAENQVKNLFARKVNIFPPQGLDAEDNFFAHQVPVDEQNPGRRYLGIYAPGVRHKAALIRVYTALLSAAQYLYSVESYSNQVDPWMTLVGYFNSLRELGGMKRAVDDSVSSRLRRMDRAGRARLSSRYISPYSVAELTSRRNATEIPTILDQLETEFDLLAEQQRRNRAAAGVGKEEDDKWPIDVLLATNMISVGVDVSRLGLMVVAGQPKNTAEYIQATSRVGRRFPGLVLTVFNWTRPRDISHYERFEHYHATFYQYVEALSVTPFAPRALDRGLSGVFVSQIRLLGEDFNANDRAAAFDKNHPYVQEALQQLMERAARIDQEEQSDLIAKEIADRTEFWSDRINATAGGALLGYAGKKDGRTLGLLRTPGSQGWNLYTCLNSLRNVEPTVNLVLDEYGMDRPGPQNWQPYAADESATGDERPVEAMESNDDNDDE
jgi:hypothetical protein